MKFVIKHEIKGRIRIHILQSRMTFEQADTLEYYLSNNKLVTSVKVRERLQDATISYIGSREDIIKLLTSFKYNNVEVPDVYLQNSGRELNREYWDKLVNKVFCMVLTRYSCRILLGNALLLQSLLNIFGMV